MPITIHSNRPEGLCSTCRHASITKADDNRQRIHCSEYGKTINATIIECSDYYQKGQLTKNDMFDIATIIDPKRKIGFAPGTEEHKALRGRGYYNDD